MDTLVSIQVVADAAASDAPAAVDAAFGWFRTIEACCNRFDPTSEVMSLTERVGEAVTVSRPLYSAVEFALAVARASDGAFDPAVGYALERRGFNRDYRTGTTVVTALDPAEPATWRDVRLDPDRRAITLERPLILDLGAVVKGLAIDLAVKELRYFASYAIDAGGDLYVRGRNLAGEPWRVGIRHPRQPDALLATLAVSDGAVCTSGDYERRVADPATGTVEHHLLDPRTGASANAVASVTVIAPLAMVADALGTAAFVLGPRRGVRFLERQGVEGLIVSPDLHHFATRGFARYRQWPQPL
jgi:thiamine biosynthesis lipoprotein